MEESLVNELRELQKSDRLTEDQRSIIKYAAREIEQLDKWKESVMSLNAEILPLRKLRDAVQVLVDTVRPKTSPGRVDD